MIAGLGFNIINYCCNTCETHGIVEVASNSCGELHHIETSCCESTNHQQTNNANQDLKHDLTCTNITHQPNSCHLLRINVETPTIVATNIVNLQVDHIELLFPVSLHTLAFSTLNDSNEFTAYSPPDTPLTAGRTILITKSVLTI